MTNILGSDTSLRGLRIGQIIGLEDQLSGLSGSDLTTGLIETVSVKKAEGENDPSNGIDYVVSTESGNNIKFFIAGNLLDVGVPSLTVTLSPPDAENTRIDVISLGYGSVAGQGQVIISEGTPSEYPDKPTVQYDELPLDLILVNTDGTTESKASTSTYEVVWIGLNGSNFNKGEYNSPVQNLAGAIDIAQKKTIVCLEKKFETGCFELSNNYLAEFSSLVNLSTDESPVISVNDAIITVICNEIEAKGTDNGAIALKLTNGAKLNLRTNRIKGNVFVDAGCELSVNGEVYLDGEVLGTGSVRGLNVLLREAADSLSVNELDPKGKQSFAFTDTVNSLTRINAQNFTGGELISIEFPAGGKCINGASVNGTYKPLSLIGDDNVTFAKRTRILFLYKKTASYFREISREPVDGGGATVDVVLPKFTMEDYEIILSDLNSSPLEISLINKIAENWLCVVEINTQPIPISAYSYTGGESTIAIDTDLLGFNIEAGDVVTVKYYYHLAAEAPPEAATTLTSITHVIGSDNKVIFTVNFATTGANEDLTLNVALTNSSGASMLSQVKIHEATVGTSSFNITSGSLPADTYTFSVTGDKEGTDSVTTVAQDPNLVYSNARLEMVGDDLKALIDVTNNGNRYGTAIPYFILDDTTTAWAGTIINVDVGETKTIEAIFSSPAAGASHEVDFYDKDATLLDTVSINVPSKLSNIMRISSWELELPVYGSGFYDKTNSYIETFFNYAVYKFDTSEFTSALAAVTANLSVVNKSNNINIKVWLFAMDGAVTRASLLSNVKSSNFIASYGVVGTGSYEEIQLDITSKISVLESSSSVFVLLDGSESGLTANEVRGHSAYLKFTY